MFVRRVPGEKRFSVDLIDTERKIVPMGLLGYIPGVVIVMIVTRGKGCSQSGVDDLSPLRRRVGILIGVVVFLAETETVVTEISVYIQVASVIEFVSDSRVQIIESRGSVFITAFSGNCFSIQSE